MLTVVDVVVAGGGPAAAAAALAARSRGLSVLVGGHRRSRPAAFAHELIPGQTLAIVRALGLSAEVVSTWVDPLPHFDSSWGSATERRADRTMATYAGWQVINRDGFDAALMRHAEAVGVDCLQQRVSRVTPTSGGHRVRFGETIEVEARIVIDATGRCRAVARMLGARVHTAHRLVACATVIPTPEPTGSTAATLRATAAGWEFALPVSATHSVHQTYASICHQRYQYGRGHRAAAVKAASTTLTQPLSSETWMTAGDAAMTLDPIGSSGVTMALKSGMRSGFAAADALHGDPCSITRYADFLAAYFGEFLVQRSQLYAFEQRFPRECFWSEQSRLGVEPAKAEALRAASDLASRRAGSTEVVGVERSVR